MFFNGTNGWNTRRNSKYSCNSVSFTEALYHFQVYVCGVHCAAIAVPVTLMLLFYLKPGVRSLAARFKNG